MHPPAAGGEIFPISPTRRCEMHTMSSAECRLRPAIYPHRNHDCVYFYVILYFWMSHSTPSRTLSDVTESYTECGTWKCVMCTIAC